MTSENRPEMASFSTRVLLTMPLDDDDNDESILIVDYTYFSESSSSEGICEHCGKLAHDLNLVGITLNGESTLLTAAQALVVANRLQRGAAMVLESEEDLPAEREVPNDEW